MVFRTFHLTEQQDQYLTELAKFKGCKKAELVRNAIEFFRLESPAAREYRKHLRSHPQEDRHGIT